MNPLHGGWLILASLLAALLLDAARLPLAAPAWTDALEPNWHAALLFFWCLAAPKRIGVVAAWLFGLLVDALASTHLGFNGLAFACIVFTANRLHDRLAAWSLLQRMLVLFALAFAIEIARALVWLVADGIGPSPLLAVPALATAALYPLLEYLLQPPAQRWAN